MDTHSTEPDASIQHKRLACELNSEVWTFLEKTDRTIEDDARMIHAAHASCYHWLHCGTALNQQRGEWLIARVYSVLGHADSAVRHAQRCMNLTQQHPDLMQDFDLAFAHEGLARALAAAGRTDEARRHKQTARQLGDAIADLEDKKYFAGDLAGGNWYGVI